MAKAVKKSSGKPKTVSEYIADTDNKVARAKLKQIRAIFKSVLPKASEELKWSMPGFVQNKIVIMYAGFKNHVSVFPGPAAIKKFAKELSKYETSKGTIKFELDTPIPTALLKKIAKFNLNEILNNDGKWK